MQKHVYRLTAYLSYIRAYTRSRVPESCNIRVYLCVCSRVSYAIYSYAATRAVAYLASIWPRRGVDTRLHTRVAVYIAILPTVLAVLFWDHPIDYSSKDGQL